MLDLLELPSGISLFRDIIVVHHCVPDLPSVIFTKDGSQSYCSIFQYGSPCRINLEWDQNNASHVGSNRTLIVRDTRLGANYPGAQLNFVNVSTPPALVLAHELGHYFYDLNAFKNIMCSKFPKIVAGAILKKSEYVALYEEKAHKKNNTVAFYYSRGEYKRIIEKVVRLTSCKNEAEEAFHQIWNTGRFREIVNILPTANILKNGGSSYSDGIMIGEVCNNVACRIYNKIQFHRITRNALQHINNFQAINAELPSESFVCFGHCLLRDFLNIFYNLSANGQDELKDLMQKLLDKITVNGQSLSAANNNLPNIN